MLSRQVSNLKSSEPKSDVLPIPPQDNGDESTDLCTVRPPLNYSLTQGVGRLIICWILVPTPNLVTTDVDNSPVTVWLDWAASLPTSTKLSVVDV